jgi:iron complex outermembrane recepter protein
MRISNTALFICFIVYSSFGQNKKTITGFVSNAISNEKIEFALVSTVISDSTIDQSTVTDKDGKFQLSGVSEKATSIQVQFLGYQTISLSIPKSSEPITIKINPSSKVLEEVTITGQTLSAVQKLDRQTFSATQFTNATGGTAYDMIKNLPSISTNAEGEISMRGSRGFILMINGKPVQSDPKSILQQMSASSIEGIDVITTPSAAYDSDGMGGIISIKSKNLTNDGVYVAAGINYGLPSIEGYGNKVAQKRYGADINYNLRKGKLDLLIGLDYLRDDRSGQRLGYVNTLKGNVLTEFPSTGERSYDNTNYSTRLSLNYQLAKNHSINFFTYAGTREQARTADIFYTQLRSLANPTRQAIDYYQNYVMTGRLNTSGKPVNAFEVYNENLRIRTGDFLIASLDYKYSISNTTNLILSSQFEKAQLGGPTDNYNYSGYDKAKIYQYQFNDNDNPLTGLRLQADLNKKYGKGILESGFQLRLVEHPGSFIFSQLNLATQKMEPVPEFTNRIDLDRTILSGYTQWTGNYKKLDYAMGLRVESTDRLVKLQKPGESYIFDTINVFPNVSMTYKLNNSTTMKLAFSQRIQRNTTNMLTPFPEREHSETLEQGDAELIPEYINNLELGFQKVFNKTNAYVTFYHRSINNLINRVNSVYNDSILNRIYTNAGKATIAGVELGGNVQINNKAKLYLGANFFNYGIEGQLFGDEINTSNSQFSINSSLDITLLKSWTTQFSINYLGERVTAQGIDSRFYTPNFFISKKINSYLTASINWINIDLGLLKTNEQRIDTWRPDFYTTTNYIHEVDILKLNLNYKFNQVSKINKYKSSEFGEKEF